MRLLLKLPFYGLAGLGCAAIVVTAMLASPVTAPPPLASLKAGAQKIDPSGKPDLTRFQARDGTWLAYRLYPGAGDRIAILAHGSSALSDEMNEVGKTLAAAGVTAVALDVRGHGASGARGDIGYAGQLEDDLADLVAQFRATQPGARFLLVGHSIGGGFAARISATPAGASFEKFVLLAPFLGYYAPTSRDGNRKWASADVPRIVALSALRRMGAPWGESLPVIAYANDPGTQKYLTSVYSYRLLADFGPDFDWGKTKGAIGAAAAKTVVICGADDDLMDAAAFESELKPLGVAVTILPHVDHMGTVHDPAALSALVAAIRENGA